VSHVIEAEKIEVLYGSIEKIENYRGGRLENGLKGDRNGTA
jgi:hypothetical protein